MTATGDRSQRHRVVIAGAGFGGLWAVKRLKGAPVDIILIDQRNHHLFQPLLYQVATASLAPSEVAWPIRAMSARPQGRHDHPRHGGRRGCGRPRGAPRGWRHGSPTTR